MSQSIENLIRDFKEFQKKHKDLFNISYESFSNDTRFEGYFEFMEVVNLLNMREELNQFLKELNKLYEIDTYFYYKFSESKGCNYSEIKLVSAIRDLVLEKIEEEILTFIKTLKLKDKKHIYIYEPKYKSDNNSFFYPITFHYNKDFLNNKDKFKTLLEQLSNKYEQKITFSYTLIGEKR